MGNTGYRPNGDRDAVQEGPGVSRRRRASAQAWWVGAGVAILCLAMNVARNHDGLHARHLELGGEYFSIAVAMADGRGFSDPFGAGTGATGWMPPGFAVLLWLTNALTGGEGRDYAAGFFPALIGLKCLCLGFGAGLLWSILRDWGLGGRGWVGFAAAWGLVVAWAQWEHVTAMMHDGWWVAFLVVLCLRGVVSLRQGRPSFLLAVAMGLAALSSPVLFAATLGVLGWRSLILAKVSRRAFWRMGMGPALPAVLVGVACFVGWSLRGWSSVGILAPVKTNGGYELWQAQELTLRGVPTHSTFELHPLVHQEARARYVEQGERAFVQIHGQEAWRLIRENPGRFLAQLRHRAVNAFVLMERRRDSLQVGGAIPSAAAEELMREKLLIPAPDPGQWRFLFLAGTDKERARQAGNLSPEAAEILRVAWAYHDEREGQRSVWDLLNPREVVLSGLASLSWVAACCLAAPRFRRRIALGLVLYLGVLGPYVLVSHYYRYQEGVMGLQVLAMAAVLSVLMVRKRKAVSLVGGQASTV